MTLIRLIQRASIIAGLTFAGFPFHVNPAHADTPQICVVANNGKTVCGTLKAVERACVATDAGSTVCGKFQSAKKGQELRQEVSKNPTPNASYRKEVDNFLYTFEGCQRVDTSVRCQVRMVNKGKDRNIGLFAYNCALVDSNGKSYPGSKADLGGGLNAATSAVMAPGMDASIAVTFENIPRQVVKAQLLNVGFGGIKPIQFRNVPISN